MIFYCTTWWSGTCKENFVSAAIPKNALLNEWPLAFETAFFVRTAITAFTIYINAKKEWVIKAHWWLDLRVASRHVFRDWLQDPLIAWIVLIVWNRFECCLVGFEVGTCFQAWLLSSSAYFRLSLLYSSAVQQYSIYTVLVSGKTCL